MARKKKLVQTTFGDRPIRADRNAPNRTRGRTEFFPLQSKKPKDIIQEAREKYGLDTFYAMTSGGGDSMTMANILDEMNMLDAVFHINTNVGLKMTTDFVKDECQRRGWKLHIVDPNPKFIYAAWVWQYGFPGPQIHKVIMSRLKYHTMHNFYYALHNEKACMISGIRSTESSRRMRNFPEPLNRDKKIWFLAPLFYLTNEEMQREKLTRDIRISPAYKLGLGFSGECMCGSYAQAGEKDFIRRHDPELSAYIDYLEKGVQLFGTPHAKRYGTWGGTSSMSDRDAQNLLDKFMGENPDSAFQELMACGSECGPGTMRGMTDI